MSDWRIPPNLFSDGNTYAVVGQGLFPSKFETGGPYLGVSVSWGERVFPSNRSAVGNNSESRGRTGIIFNMPRSVIVALFSLAAKKGRDKRRTYGVRKILPEYGSSTGVPGGKPRT